MKFGHIADCHVGGWREEELRVLSVKSLERAAEICIEEHVAFLLISGDLFNTSMPQIEMIKEVTSIFNRLREHDIAIYIIPGSHDYSPSGKTMLDVLEHAGLVVNVMKFKEGKIIDRFYVKTGELITIRFPRKSDTGGLRKYINFLVGEKARILLNRKQSLKEEKKWLADILEKSRKNKNVSLVAETNENIIGFYQLKRNEGSKYHTATYAAGILKEYRKLGITKIRQ